LIDEKGISKRFEERLRENEFVVLIQLIQLSPC